MAHALPVGAFSIPGSRDPDGALEDLGVRVAFRCDLHAELGPQVGDGGGGSADDKFGDLEIWRFGDF